MLMQIDGTIIFVIISFLIFLFIIKTILYAPITKVVDERNNFYAKNSKMELESKEKSKALLEEKESLLNKARLEASNILSNTNEEALAQSEEEIKQTKKITLEKIEKNKNILAQEKQNAKIEIKNEITNIVKSIASRVLRQEVEINLDEDSINNYLKI